MRLISHGFRPVSGFRVALMSVRFLVVIAVILALLAGQPQAAWATDAADKRRVDIGLKIFRATLAADQALPTKAGPQGKLTVVLFFVDDRPAARGFGRRLEAQGPLADYELQVVLTDDPTLSDFSSDPPAGVLITESRLPPHVLQELQAFSRAHSVVLFSPFEKHVRQGVPTGLFIAARVQPYVNPSALRRSAIELKAFFLRVAKTTE